MKVLIIFGTRPEAIKLAPLVRSLQAKPGVKTVICSTGQHREMLEQVLQVFKLIPDINLNIMKKSQSLSELTAELLLRLQSVLEEIKPDWVVVQGDTTTAFAGSLAAFYKKISVAHVEAGLRTGSLLSPWPEEGLRRLITPIADVHFAPTSQGYHHLMREGVAADRILITGNTVIDALFLALKELKESSTLQEQMQKKFAFLDPNPKRRLILVTGHRRESFGQGFENICLAIKKIAARQDVQIIYPVHLNPQVRQPVYEHLGQLDNVFLIEPLEYLEFIEAMRRSTLILTDSGGVQEEAPSLGKPVLVMRDRTERPEAIQAGTSILVGTEIESIVSQTELLLDNSEEYERRKQIANPFGDGEASRRIADAMWFGPSHRNVWEQWFDPQRAQISQAFSAVLPAPVAESVAYNSPTPTPTTSSRKNDAEVEA